MPIQSPISPCPCLAAHRWAMVGLVLITLGTTTLQAADPSGRAIYMKHCASCHGKVGEGVKGEYKDPLIGDKSIASLTKYVEKWMPEEEPKDVAGPDAQKVSQYIFDAFYSHAAQLRNHPPKIEPARLTNRQYENAVADLLASFRGPNWHSDKRGLNFNLYNRKGPGGKPVKTEIVHEVNVAYDNKPPHPALEPSEKDKKDKKKKYYGPQYSMSWRGSIHAPVTGDYEFIVETTNGMKLVLNNVWNKPLINMWVRSGDEKVHRAKIRLLGGRVYPINLDVFKEKREKAVSVKLRWKPPHGTEQPLPAHIMRPNGSQPTFAVTTRFPPDDASFGYVRGVGLSKAWDEATTHAALEVAEHVIEHFERYGHTKPTDKQAVEKARVFAHRFTERAFRRPLSNEQKAFFVDRLYRNILAGDKVSLERAIKRHIVLTLKSPRFLFREMATPEHDAFDIAERMSFAMWDSIPDQKLFDAARHGKLKDRKGVVAELERMSRDPRTRSKVRTFFRAWLGLNHLHELNKNTNRFPEFSADVVADLRTSLDLSIDALVWSDKSDYRRLLTDDGVYLNARLAKVYGAQVKPDAGFQKVSMPKQRRSGVITHPLLMAGYAYDTTSSPIHRGVFVAKNLLGRRLRPPKEAVTPESPDLHPGLTTRQVIAKQTAPKACAGCHSMINPLGFTLENFDALGRFRVKDKGKLVNTSGHYKSVEGKTQQFKGAPELGRFLADSPEAHAAFVQRMFQHTVHQSIHAYGLDRHQKLTKNFVDGGYHIRRLLIELIADAALHPRGPRKDGKTS